MSTIKANAIHYENNSNIQKKLAKLLIKKLDLEQPNDILDVGCGSGHDAAHFSQINALNSVTGCDISSEMIGLCKKEYPAELYPNLKFCKSTLNDFKKPTSFDLITCFSAFHWVSNPNQAISHIYDLLKPNGEVLILTYPKDSPFWQPFINCFSLATDKFKESAISNWRTSDEYKCYFENEKLIPIEHTESLETVFFPSRSALRDYIYGWLWCINPFTEKEAKEYVDAVMDQMFELYSSSEGITIPYLKLVMHYRKSED